MTSIEISPVVKFLRNASNFFRTVASRFELFFPVTQKRWRLAQRAEIEHWAGTVAGFSSSLRESHTSHLIETFQGPGSRFFLELFETDLGLSIRELVSGGPFIEVACGAASVFLEVESKHPKFGVDPVEFAPWVVTRYQDRGVTLFVSPAEDFDFLEIRRQVDRKPKEETEVITVLFTNGLQHFRSPSQFFYNLRALGHHRLVFLEFLEVPADAAHPQILTVSRLRKFLRKNNYRVVREVVGERKLAGVIEYGGGRPAKIYQVLAESPR